MKQNQPQEISAWKTLWQQLPTAVCVLQLKGSDFSLLAVSAGMADELGGTAEDYQHFTPDQMIRMAVPADRMRLEKDFARFIREGRTCSGIYAFLNPESGAEERVAVSARRDSAGLIYLSFCRLTEEDLTGRQKPDEQYRQQLSRMAQHGEEDLLVKIHSSLEKDSVLKCIGSDVMAARFHPGMTFAAAAAEFFDMAASPAERAQLTETLDAAHLIAESKAGNHHYTLQFRQDSSGLTPRWILLAVHTFQNPEQGYENFIYAYDNTEKVLEAQMFSRLTMLGFDTIGLLYVKTGALRFFRLKLFKEGSLYENVDDYNTSIIGDIETVLPQEDRRRARQSLAIPTITAHLAQAPIYSFNYSLKSPNGMKQKLLQFSWLDEKKDTIFLCKSDITAQAESESRQLDELRKAKLEAEQADQAKSAFLSCMSHDLRTPLNGIIGFTRLALHEQDETKEKEYLAKIADSGGLLMDLINDTLEMSRIESGKSVLEEQDVNAYDLVHAVLTALSPSADLKGIQLISNAEEISRDKIIHADRLKIQKILLNLLSNAIKYTPEGGRVQLLFTQLSDSPDGCSCQMIVRDNGIGMSPEFLPKIFLPFSQEKRRESAQVLGTGLGMSIVKQYVDLMHGTIQVKSTLGAGSEFTVRLPIQPGGKMPQMKAASSDSMLRGKHLLLCEDSRMNTEIALAILNEKGMCVDTAADGSEGVKRFAQSAPGTYDAILMDIRMPVMDGFEAVRQIRRLDRPDAAAVPIIAMTADAFAEDLKQSRQSGMNGYVLKPIDPQQLMEVLKELIQHSQQKK